MFEPVVEKKASYDIMTPEEVAQYLRKSTSWVYKHWRELGGRKLGGSLFFPGKENLYERLFGKGQGMEVRLHLKRDQADSSLVQDKKRRSEGGNGKKGGNTKAGVRDARAGDGDPNRHLILGFG
jgi:hypothetical protein